MYIDEYIKTKEIEKYEISIIINYYSVSINI